MTAAAAKILCVDDEPSGLYFRRLILEKNGYQVETATNQGDALDAFRNSEFRLVITDHLLGRGTGTAMAIEMKRTKPHIPIIVLSGTVDVPEGLGVADAFVSKTEGPEVLLEKVEELLKANEEGSDGARSLALREPRIQQTLLSAIVESSDDAIFSKSLSGVILTWNKAAERMYGYTQEEMIGKNISRLVPEEKRGELREIMRRLNSGETIDHLETNRIAKNGRVLTVQLTISPIRDEQGFVLAAATTARDVTETRMAERALRDNERLATAGRMAATVAHEINNPLEAVTNILYLLEQAAGFDPTAKDFVLIAEKEIARIREIAQLTLSFHRQTSPKREPVSLPKLIDGVLTLYGRRIQTLGLRIRKEYECDGIVEGVSGEIRQVISNLILNAFDALEQNGNSLCVRVSNAIDPTGEQAIRVTIADNGPGMAREQLRHIFQPFYTTKGEKGTGLGLWVSQGIIERHGGSIRVRSTRSGGRVGTTFSVVLPRKAAEQGSKRAA